MRQGILFFIMMGLLFQTPTYAADRLTPRQAFYYHAHTGNINALIQLQQMGYPIDVSDDYGNSALCEAVIKQDSRAIQTLIQAGADTNATCMQVLSADMKQSVPQVKQSLISIEANQKDKLASSQVSKIPNPPAEPLSKNTKVGIGLGVVTLAAVGAGVAALVSGGGGGDKTLNCVDGVQVGKSCQCNPHAVGDLCDSCEAGYGMHGTRSCHQDQSCGDHSKQLGDECVCLKGFDFKDPKDGNCYKDLKCSSIYDNMHQEKDKCECDSGYNKYSGDPPSATTGCYVAITCGTNMQQVNNSCQCTAAFPVPHISGGVLTECSTCGVTGATYDGSKCQCPLSDPIAEYNGDGITLAKCHSCSEHVSATWDGSQCYCSDPDKPVTVRDGLGIPTSCESCPTGSTYNKATNKCDCGYNKIVIDNQCVEDLHCYDQAHSTGTQTSATACECKSGWAGNLCTTCASGYVSINGDCVKVLTSATVNNGTIERTAWTEGSVIGLYSKNADITNTVASTTTAITGEIALTRTEESGDMYGIYSDEKAYGVSSSGKTKQAISTITLTNTGNSATYGIYAKGDVRSLYVAQQSAYITDMFKHKSTVSITNMDGGNTYGLYSSNGSVYGMDTYFFNRDMKSEINLYNKNGTSIGLYAPSGNAYGLYITYTSPGGAGYTTQDMSNINLYQWGGSARAMEGKNVVSSNRIKSYPDNSLINMYLVGTTTETGGETVASGEIIGMRSTTSGGEIVNNYRDEIRLHLIGGEHTEETGGVEKEITVTTDNTRAIGIYAGAGVSVKNQPDQSTDNIGFIGIDRTGFSYNGTTYTAGPTGTAYGIYVKGGAAQTITNNGIIVIAGSYTYNPTDANPVTTTAGSYDAAYGIYIEDGKDVEVINNGDIYIDINGSASGIYFENGTGGSIINRGKITIGSASCSGEGCYSAPNAIHDGGAEKKSTTKTSPSALVLNGANLIASKGSAIETEGGLDLDLHLSSDITTSGFSDVYTEKNMIQASDTTGLKLISDSALFNASLADNGRDVIMTMKGFETATTNPTLAKFLATNYSLGNNEAFYNKLKSFADMTSLTESLNKLTGKDILSRFNFEDMTMMRELNYDMNDKLFHNKEVHFALASSVSPMAFKGDTGSDARYSLYNKRDGNKSIGLGVAFTNVRSNDENENNNRRETSYQLILPMGYKTNGFNFVTSPRIGYARGTYDRIGFDGTNYDGVIEKRVFGLMNEVRYPITLGKWSFEPTIEFNLLGYQQKGHEDAKEFALNIQNQNTYSVESGIGLYATREEELGKETTLKLSAGVAAYHEFADPYHLKVGMRGMDGAFTLYDENRSDNRGVIRAGFDYAYRDLALYGSLTSYIDQEWRTRAKTGMKVKF